MFENSDLNEISVRVSDSSSCLGSLRTQAVHRAPPAKAVHPEVSAQTGYLLQQMNLVCHFVPDWQSLRRAFDSNHFRPRFAQNFLKPRTPFVAVSWTSES